LLVWSYRTDLCNYVANSLKSLVKIELEILTLKNLGAFKNGQFAFQVSRSGIIYGLFVYICQITATGIFIFAIVTNLVSKHLLKYGRSAQQSFMFPKQNVQVKDGRQTVVTLFS